MILCSKPREYQSRVEQKDDEQMSKKKKRERRGGGGKGGQLPDMFECVLRGDL